MEAGDGVDGGIGVCEADAGGDDACGDGVVSGDHFDLDAGAAAVGDGGDGFGAGGIDHALEAEEGEAGGEVVVIEGVVIGVGVEAGEGEDAEALAGHFVDGLADGGWVERGGVCVLVECFIAAVEEAFDCADLVDGAAGGVSSAVECGAEHVFGFERDHVDAGVVFVDFGVDESGFGGGDEECGFGGVALCGVLAFVDDDL